MRVVTGQALAIRDRFVNGGHGPHGELMAVGA